MLNREDGKNEVADLSSSEVTLQELRDPERDALNKKITYFLGTQEKPIMTAKLCSLSEYGKLPTFFQIDAITDKTTRNTVFVQLQKLVKFLELPIIYDGFRNSSERRIYKFSISGKYDPEYDGKSHPAFVDKKKFNPLYDAVIVAMSLEQTLEGYLYNFSLLSGRAEDLNEEMKRVVNTIPDLKTYVGEPGEDDDVVEKRKNDIVKKVTDAVVNLLAKVQDLLEELSKQKKISQSSSSNTLSM